jgi:hypothetical protein
VSNFDRTPAGERLVISRWRFHPASAVQSGQLSVEKVRSQIHTPERDIYVTDASLALTFGAPSLVLASGIAEAAFNEFHESRPDAVQPNIDLRWSSMDHLVTMTVGVRCASISEARSIQKELAGIVTRYGLLTLKQKSFAVSYSDPICTEHQ